MFGIDIIDASFLTSVMISFAAGILSFLSPCVLPIVPPYLAYMSGINMNQLSLGKHRLLDTFLPALMFVIGLSTVFLIMGLVASSFGNFFLINQLIMNRISGIVVIIFSIHFLGIFRIPILERDIRFEARNDFGCTYTKSYIPDDNFEYYLEMHNMGDGIQNNDSVLTKKINEVDSLNIMWQEISNISGIEQFVNLRYLIRHTFIA